MAERYAVMDAGRASARDPGATIVPQRARAREWSHGTGERSGVEINPIAVCVNVEMLTT